jgi:prepilin-type N-terminal cleavage/methylation domain-containing protein
MKLRSIPDCKGFTLAELMIAVVIIGLLTAIVLPRLSMAKDRGFIATMQSDLRQFAAHEESYFYDNSVYTPNLGLLAAAGFNQSAGVTLTIAEATATGWAAIAAHTQSSGVECALFSGTAAPVGASTEEGVIACM